jgi:hypothetical protein
MLVTLDTLKKAIQKKGYKWFEDQPNIIGVRTTLQIPDVFNDVLFCVFKDKDGKEVVKSWTITTNPGLYWLLHPANTLGTAVLKPGQYINSHAIGFHQGKADHKALVQINPVTVYRDNNKNDIAESSSKTETGLFGINIHRSNKTGTTQQIGKWSAGCLVFPQAQSLEQLLWICEQYKKKTGNKFTLTLLEEKDLA